MLILLRGPSGIGKSYISDVLSGREKWPEEHVVKSEWPQTILNLRKRIENDKKMVTVHSADNFFIDNEGQYKFEPSKLSLAHNWCIRSAVEALREGATINPSHRVVIVDNTNTSIAECAPYIGVAKAYEHEVLVLTLVGNLDIYLSRQKHGVSHKSLIMQHENLMKSLQEWPPWWPQEVFYMLST